MSRAGTPTDNPVIESKNGWIKKEMYIDFDINNYNTVQEFIDDMGVSRKVCKWVCQEKCVSS